MPRINYSVKVAQVIAKTVPPRRLIAQVVHLED